MASEDDNYGSLSVKGTPVAELKINDIKKELDKRGLSKAGSKTQMLERLKAQLLLEKLQQDAAQSSGDELEGKVPNMALQQESAGQSEFVRQYLQQQQRNLERQMEVKKQVEEERKRKSADESSADETVTPQDNTKPKVDPDVTSPKKFKDGSSNAPATEESKMPRPARKSSRNASKGENGQDTGISKEKSRSPSPEKESLRERTRSGSSSSSRSATPEATTRRGRSARGARGGRTRGGRRGRGRPGISRKESRSSSHSSTEEEVMPKKRSRRSTNSISSRSRSRSPQKTSPDVTPATRRSSRRVSAAKTPPDQDLLRGSTPSEVVQKSKEPLVNDNDPVTEKPKDDDSKATLDLTDDAKTAVVKEVRRSVEVLVPVEGTIKTIEVADVTSEKGQLESTGNCKADEKTSLAQVLPQASESTHKQEQDSRDVIDAKHSGQSEREAGKVSAEQNPVIETVKESEPDSKHLETPRSDKEKQEVDSKASGKGQDTLDSTGPAEQLSKDSEGKQNTLKIVSVPSATAEQAKQIEEDESKESSKRARQRNSSSSSSSSASPPRKRDTQRGRSNSSGSSTDVSMSAQKDLTKNQTEEDNSSEKSKADMASQPVDSKDQESESNLKGDATVNIQEQSHGEKGDGNQVLQKNKDNETEIKTSTPTVKKMDTDCGDDKQQEGAEDASEEAAADQKDQAPKSVNDEAVTKKDKTAKKRKWGSKSSKIGATATKKPTSMEISSDSLKNLIGEVKLSETVFDMETEVVNTLDYDEQEEDRRDVKVKRTVVKNSPSGPDTTEIAEEGDDEDARKVETSEDIPDENGKDQKSDKVEDDEVQADNDEEGLTTEPKKKQVAKSSPSAGSVAKETGKKKVVKEGKKVKKKKGTGAEASESKENKIIAKDNVAKEPAKIVATTRPSKPILPMVDEPEKVPGRGDMSPARHPPDRVLRIAGLVRPFTLGQLKELLKRTGDLDEEHFWINDIKSHCFAAFKTEEDAVKTRLALHGTRWPQSNPKILIVDFATIEDVIHRKSGGEGPPPASMRKNLQEQRSQRESKEEPKKDSLPKDRGDGDRADSRDSRRRPSATEQGERRKEGDKAARERERPPPQVREWDKDKMKQPSRSRSKSKDRDRPARRSRSGDRDQRKRRDGSRDKREDEKKKEKRQKEPKAEEEPPAKLLDDLFRKTKATPCIYWLPLTEEQAQQREEHEKEKQKRKAAAEEKEKEEYKKREAARQERQRQREKEEERAKVREARTDRGRSRSRSISGSRSRRRR